MTAIDAPTVPRIKPVAKAFWLQIKDWTDCTDQEAQQVATGIIRRIAELESGPERKIRP